MTYEFKDRKYWLPDGCLECGVKMCVYKTHYVLPVLGGDTATICARCYTPGWDRHARANECKGGSLRKLRLGYTQLPDDDALTFDDNNDLPLNPPILQRQNAICEIDVFDRMNSDDESTVAF